jgi:CRP-like cAMP-binding protein
LAGVNKSLKAGSVVFKSGDDPDGMYVVRKGELIVYLEQESEEIVLAKIPAGGIVGEMALFEKRPRSASVKAGIDSEITHISEADFTALMKQIPKWFVGLMGALSSRLRTTNDRLKNLESPGQADRGGITASTRRPYLNTIRILHTIELILLRDGIKDGKDIAMNRKDLEEQLIAIFGESPQRVQGLIDVLSSEMVLSSKMDAYKNSVLTLTHRANLTQFTKFLTMLSTNNPKLTDIPEPVVTIFKLLAKMAPKSPYDSFTATLEDLISEAATEGLDSVNFQKYVGSITTYGETVKTTKASGQSGVGLKVNKADIQGFVRNVLIFSQVSGKQLD